MKSFLKKMLCLVMLGASVQLYADPPQKSQEPSLNLGGSAKPSQAIKPWVVYYDYDEKIAASAFEPYDLVILDVQHHPNLQPLMDRGKTLVGYLNAGEVEEREVFYNEVKAQGILLQENEDWKKSYFVDMRDKRWTKRVIEEIIPRILHKGFQGVCLDTLDNCVELEEAEPVKYKGMRDAAVNFVKAIRYHYPKITLIMNRGLPLVKDLGDTLTMVMGEVLYTRFDRKEKIYKLNDPKVYEEEVSLLKKMKAQFPKLRILSLEYWDPKDTAKIKEIYALQRKNGFEPYVSVLELNAVFPEPK